jgi:hypothetical protein
MNKMVRLSVFALALIAGIFLAGCGPIPAGAEIKVNPDGKSAQVEFTGTVDSIAADQWVVAGQTLVITPLTVLDAILVTGDMVKVHATVILDGTITADSIALYTPEPPSPPEADHTNQGKKTVFVGLVEAVSPESWVVSGRTFAITPQTEIKDSIIVGDKVIMKTLKNADGTFTATVIKLIGQGMGKPNPGPVSDKMEMTGTVESIAADQWIVSGATFVINPETEIKGTIIVGDLVKVEALVGTDGVLTAHEIKLADETSLTPEPPSTDDDGQEMEYAGVVESIAADTWTVSGKTFAITPETEIKGTIIVGDLVKIEARVGSDGTLTAHEIKLADESNENHEDGSEMEFTGMVESIGPESWTVDGKTLAITLETKIKGTIIVGDSVKVEAYVNLDGTLTAHEIEKEESHDSHTPGGDSDEHGSNPGSGTSSDDRDQHGSNHGSGMPSDDQDHD